MKKIIYLTLVLLTLGCTETPKIVLPEVADDFEVVENASDIVYVSYEEGMAVFSRESDAEPPFHFWIAKDLPLQFITDYLKEDSHLAVSNSASGNISYYKSKSNIISPDQFSRFYIKERPEAHMKLLSVSVNFKSNDSITIDGTYVEEGELLPFLEEYIAFAGEGKQSLIYLNFDQRLSLQEYLTKRLKVNEIEGQSRRIAKEEFIYDRKVVDSLIAECNCEL